MTNLTVGQTYTFRDSKFVEVPNTLDYLPLAFRDEADGLPYVSGLKTNDHGLVIRDKETGSDILEYLTVEDVEDALALDGDLHVVESMGLTYIFLEVLNEKSLELLGYTLVYFK